MLPETTDEETLADRAELLSALSLRLEMFAATQGRASPELRARVRSILVRYPDVSEPNAVKPGTPLARYSDARMQVIQASRRARL
jgi:hypothetical protein